MKLMITGGCGFLGSNLAQDALSRGDDLLVFDNLQRLGSQENFIWLKEQGEFQFVHGDIRNSGDVSRVISSYKPDVIFHLAGQVAMTTSIDNPRADFEVNAFGSMNVLESVREHVPDCIVVYSSTNKVYGDLEQYTYEEGKTRYVCKEKPEGYDEKTPLEFHSPYGCSKGAADQYMLDYARIFGLKTVVFRHSSMYGGRQFSTYDQGWVGWFCQQGLNQKSGDKSPFTISGNGKQVRDVLHSNDMRKLYLAAVENIGDAKGQAFNIGGGFEQSLSLLELFELIEGILDISLNYTQIEARKCDQKIFIADLAKANKLIKWQPEVTSRDGVEKMINWLCSR